MAEGEENMAFGEITINQNTKEWQYNGRKPQNVSRNSSFSEVLNKTTEGVTISAPGAAAINDKKVPYGHLAEDGLITYNGVTFFCDYKNNAICLGDMSNPKEVINVALEGGGVLKVNRDSIGDLVKAIDMFSPEDVKRILDAIARDNFCRSKLQEIEDEKGKIGQELAEEENL